MIESRDKSYDSIQDNDPSAQDAVRVSVLVSIFLEVRSDIFHLWIGLIWE